MHPRWHSDQPGAPLCPNLPGQRSSGASQADLFNEPLPDLEEQLAAELEGAAWAVVAFTSEDVQWCDWIYRNLNGYTLPISLVDRVTPHGFPRPGCISVFPDRRDPAYQEQLPRALEHGVYLIVVCSPESARSGAVDEQIRAFKKAGGEERIIALVVDGTPEADLGERLRAAQCDWLPSWLRWRLEDDGFRIADRAEPRVVDARNGYRGLRQVRDGLLTALVDMDAAEFDRLGGCNRPVEGLTLPESTPVIDSPAMTTAVAITPSETADRRGSRFTISVAVVLILVAVVFGTRSFLEITADEPVSTLDVGPVTGVLAGHSTKFKTASENLDGQGTPLSPDAAPAPEPPPEFVAVAPSAPEPVVAKVSEPQVAKASEPVPRANVAQMAPAPVLATTHIVPVDVGAPVRSPVFVNPPPTYSVMNTEADAVLLDEVKTLERRGDETMAEKRTEDALDLYHTALLSAQEYAMRKGVNPTARDQVVMLERKLGLLQLQNSSTAEARATYTQARKALLLLKSQGLWSRERAKALDEIEGRLLTLPRD